MFGNIPLHLLLLVLEASSEWPYLQTYPPVNETDGRSPLHFALVLSFGGTYRSIGALPGVQIALDYINSDPSLLPGYTLHYTLTDSQCERSTAVSSYFAQMTNPPTKVGWIGSGCTPATEPTAELTHYHNITQVSCVSSSPILHNRQRFRYYFQLLSPGNSAALGFYSMVQYFGWRRIGIITQDSFIGGVEVLKKVLAEDEDVEYTEWYFRTDEGISNINAFDSQIRIFVVAMYSDYARDLFCEAYKRGLVSPKYMFITYGWYGERWWGEGAISSDYNCTSEDLATVALYSVAAVLAEFPDEPDAIAEPNITVSEFHSLYNEAVNRDVNQHIGIEKYIDKTFQYSYHCHEATLSLAYALNKTISDLSENETLNREAAELSGLPKGENFTMANFTYANSAVLSLMFKHLHSTMFHGIAGNDVVFDDHGTRVIDKILIMQYQKKKNGSRDDLVWQQVGVVYLSEDNNEILFTDSFHFPEGIPNDGIPVEEVVSVSVALTVVYVILTTAGLVFAVVCILFNLFFRQKRLIRLSSRNLNYIIGLGAITIYLNVITLVIPTTNPHFAALLCNINPWLLSLGYSLCFGTVTMKMVRVWVIFNSPFELNSSTLRWKCIFFSIPLRPLFKDHLMALFVLFLTIIDMLILLLYTVAEAVRNDIGVKLTPNQELPEETFGATAEHHKYFLYVCESDGQVVLYAVLFGYKGLLQALALLLAFRTRNVKVKGLDDSVYIAASIYITSVMLAVIIVSTYTLMDYVNVYPAVVGMGLLLGTTAILGLVFIPRMVELYKDPKGETINTHAKFNEESVTQETDKNGKEIRTLRRRVTELEITPERQTSLNSIPIPPTPDRQGSVSFSSNTLVMTDIIEEEKSSHEERTVYENGREELPCGS